LRLASIIMSVVSVANFLFSVGVILSQVFLLGLLVGVLFFKKELAPVLFFLQKHGLLLACAVAVGSMLASLFYSLVAGFPPCDLCWYQRIFMYSSAVVLLSAVIKKDTRVAPYVLLLSVIGAAISGYHNVVSYGGVRSVCSILNTSVSCTKRYVFEFGYITIPMMALTAFALVIVLLIFAASNNHSSAST